MKKTKLTHQKFFTITYKDSVGAPGAVIGYALSEIVGRLMKEGCTDIVAR